MKARLLSIIALLLALVTPFLVEAATPRQAERYNAALQIVKTGNFQGGIAEFAALCREGFSQACNAERQIRDVLAKSAAEKFQLDQARSTYNQQNFRAAANAFRGICQAGNQQTCDRASLSEAQAMRQEKNWRGALEKSRQPCRTTRRDDWCDIYSHALDVVVSIIHRVEAPGRETIAEGVIADCAIMGPPSCTPIFNQALAFLRAECAGGPIVNRHGSDLCTSIPADIRFLQTNWQPARRLGSATQSSAINRGESSTTFSQASRPIRPTAATAQTPTALPAKAQSAASPASSSFAGPAKGQRTRLETADASKCLTVDRTPGIFGAFRNSCKFKVVYTMCVVDPSPDAWSSSFRCVPGASPKHLGFVGPNDVAADHNRGGKGVHWFACRYSAAGDPNNFDMVSGSVRYHTGEGLKGTCSLEVRGG